MKNFTFVIIDDNQITGLKTRAIAESFQNLLFLATATNYDEGIDIVLEHNPDLIFLEIDPSDKDSNLSLSFINELHRYLKVIPKIFVTTKNDSLCLNAFKYGVYDYFINPIEVKELRKSLFRFEKEFENSILVSNLIMTQAPVIETVTNVDLKTSDTTALNAIELENKTSEQVSESIKDSEEEIANIKSDNENPSAINNATFTDFDQTATVETIVNEVLTSNSKEVSFLQTENTQNKPLVICVKSYGDYRYIEAKDICYLQADNNSTDIHLHTGEMITAFKTLKHFEGVMTYPFVRIHNSYIVNVDFVSRIHTGNTVCHIKNTTTKLPFSKSYKENIDAVISTIASGNYLEI